MQDHLELAIDQSQWLHPGLIEKTDFETRSQSFFTVAGFSTRFLPATKAIPRDLLPIVDKPLIQYSAEETIAAGIDTLVFVTGSNKMTIEDHFDSDQELEAALWA